jgi:nitrogen fixation protein FixH
MMGAKSSTNRKGLVASGAIWPLGIIALLAMNMSIVGITIYYATSDPSVAAEPNYYEKAVKWDQSAAQSVVNKQIGWHAALVVEHAVGGTLVARLTDSDGKAVEHAVLIVETFHHARSGSRKNLTLVERAPGEYACGVGAERAGRWRVRLAAQVGMHLFTSETDIDVDEASIGGSV